VCVGYSFPEHSQDLRYVVCFDWKVWQDNKGSAIRRLLTRWLDKDWILNEVLVVEFLGVEYLYRAGAMMTIILCSKVRRSFWAVRQLPTKRGMYR